MGGPRDRGRRGGRAGRDRAPQAFGHALGVIAQVAAMPREIAIVGDPADPRTAALRAVVDARYAPHEAVVVADPADPLFDSVPLLRAGRRSTACPRRTSASASRAGVR